MSRTLAWSCAVVRPGRVARQAYTLVELVVLTSVFALLVSFPFLRPTRAREQAKRVYCAANLKQIAEAWGKFLDANSGRFLQHVNANINFGGKQGSDPAYGGDANRPVPKPLNAHLGLPPVTADAKVFHCPADSGGGITKETTYFDFYGSSYATNPLLIGQTQQFWPAGLPCSDVFKQINERLPSLNESQVAKPHKLILLGDAGWVNTWHPGSTQRIEWHQRKSWHNVAFFDGHVEFISLRKGVHTSEHYTVIPWRDLQDAARGCQQEQN